MKKTAAKHSHRIKFNPTEFFTKNIGIMGLVVVILFFVIYLMSQKLSKLEDKVILMESNSNTKITEPTSSPESNLDMMPLKK